MSVRSPGFQLFKPFSPEPRPLQGWRLYCTCIATSLCLFLANLELTIVGTSLVAISDDLGEFVRGTWVVAAYLLTFTCLTVVWAKLSDIFSRKTCMLSGLVVFIAFSGACAASTSMTMLIVLRAMQGIGGSGLNAMAFTIGYQVVERPRIPLYVAAMSVSAAIGGVCGPILGGIISTQTSWRWIFIVNVPAGCVAVTLAAISIPSLFPFHETVEKQPFNLHLLYEQLRDRLDFVGFFALLGGAVLLVTPLLEAGVAFAWNSTLTSSMLILSGALWILFCFNEHHQTRSRSLREPIFPWRFVKNRVWMGTLLISLFGGLPTVAVIVSIPQRLQVLDGYNGLQAAISIIPFVAVWSTGSFVSNIVTKRFQIPAIYTILFGSVAQLAGFLCIYFLAGDRQPSTKLYGFEALAGFGVGTAFGVALSITTHVVLPRDVGTASGAIVQVRYLGSCIGLAIIGAVWNNAVMSGVGSVLTADEIGALQREAWSLTKLPPEIRSIVVEVFLRAYNYQILVLAGFAALQVLVTFLIWCKPQLKV